MRENEGIRVGKPVIFNPYHTFIIIVVVVVESNANSVETVAEYEKKWLKKGNKYRDWNQLCYVMCIITWGIVFFSFFIRLIRAFT